MSDDGDAVLGPGGPGEGSEDGPSPQTEPRSGNGRGTPIVEAAMAMWQQGASGINPEIIKHLRPEHIDKALDHAVLILVGLLLFSGNAAILADHFDVVMGFAAGAAGGYGLGRGQS